MRVEATQITNINDRSRVTEAESALEKDQSLDRQKK